MSVLLYFLSHVLYAGNILEGLHGYKNKLALNKEKYLQKCYSNSSHSSCVCVNWFPGVSSNLFPSIHIHTDHYPPCFLVQRRRPFAHTSTHAISSHCSTATYHPFYLFLSPRLFSLIVDYKGTLPNSVKGNSLPLLADRLRLETNSAGLLEVFMEKKKFILSHYYGIFTESNCLISIWVPAVKSSQSYIRATHNYIPDNYANYNTITVCTLLKLYIFLPAQNYLIAQIWPDLASNVIKMPSHPDLKNKEGSNLLISKSCMYSLTFILIFPPEKKRVHCTNIGHFDMYGKSDTVWEEAMNKNWILASALQTKFLDFNSSLSLVYGARIMEFRS